MTSLVFLLLWFGVPSKAEIPALELHQAGYVTYYNPGVAQQVLRNRIRYWDQLHPFYGHIPPCLAALNDDHVDEYILVRLPKSDNWELCYVIDCAQKSHAVARDRLKLYLEVDFDTFNRWNDTEVEIYLLGKQ